MKIKNAYYPRHYPLSIIVEIGGKYYMARHMPIRHLTQADLKPIACWHETQKIEMPSLSLRMYGLDKED